MKRFHAFMWRLYELIGVFSVGCLLGSISDKRWPIAGLFAAEAVVSFVFARHAFNRSVS